MIKQRVGFSGTNAKLTVLTVLIAVLIFPVTAQKKRKRKKKTSEPIEVIILTEEKKAEAEHYFIEAEKFYLIGEQEKAFELFSKVLSLDANNSTSSYKLAQILFSNKEYAKALEYGKRATSSDPTNKYFYLLLAEIYTNLSDLSGAIQVYKELIENVKGSEQYLFDMAGLLFYTKRYDEALAAYDEIKEHYGPMEQISFQRQQIYLKQNKLDLAIKEGEALIQSSPDEPQYVIALAQLLISNEKLEEAKKLLTEGLPAESQKETSSILMAEIHRKSGDITKALEVLIPAFGSENINLTLKLKTLGGYLNMLPNETLNEPLMKLAEQLALTHPDSYRGHGIAGELQLNAGKKEAARKSYLKAIELDGSNFSIWQNIISIDLDLQELDDAITHSDQALEIFPNQASLYYFGGTAHLLKKNYQEAISTFNAGKIYTSGNPNLKSVFNGQLGDAYNSVGDHKKSDAAYEEALKAKPDNDHVLNNYSYFLSLRKENLNRALEMSQKLVDAYPDRSTYLDTHAWVLYVMGNYEQAEIYLKRAVNTVDVSGTIIEHYGDVLFKLGSVDKAVRQWEKARDMSDGTSLLDKKIADKKLYE